jgi:hypothetical protein
MVNAGDEFPAGEDYIVRRIKDLERRVSENASARSLAASQIGSGGLLISGGGSLTISGGGSLNVAGGALNSAGSITAGTTISAGGAITGASLGVGGGAISGGAITGASVAVTGAASSASLSVSGGASSDTLTAPSGISSLNARSRVLATSYASLWVDGTGQFGQSPSSLRYKQDVLPATIDTTGILALVPKNYRLKVAVEGFGINAPVEVGLIAEEVEPVAPWAVYRDVDGLIQGINYDRLSVGILAIAKAQHAQIAALTARLDKAGL